jgi:PadR family transcriptional regulator PadR
MGKDGYLGEFEQMLLLAMMQLGEDAYGVRLSQILEEQVGRRVSRGSVYVTLDRMEDKGWISSKVSEARPERGGRPRRIVAMTPAGVEQLKRSRGALLTLWTGLEEALDTP